MERETGKDSLGRGEDNELSRVNSGRYLSPMTGSTYTCYSFFAALSEFLADDHARVAELADAPDLGSGTERCGGSSPPFRTKIGTWSVVRCQ